MWAVKPKSSAWWPPPSMCVADITSLPTRHPSFGSTETSHLASPGSSHVTQISHDGRQFRHRVFPPQLPPWPPQRRWRWLEVRLPRPSESDAPRTGADLPKPEWQSCVQSLIGSAPSADRNHHSKQSRGRCPKRNCSPARPTPVGSACDPSMTMPTNRQRRRHQAQYIDNRHSTPPCFHPTVPPAPVAK